MTIDIPDGERLILKGRLVTDDPGMGLNDAEKSAWFRITAQDTDRVGDVVVTGGIDWEPLRQKAGVFLMHDYSLPVGTPLHPDGTLAVKAGDGEAFGKVYFTGDTADEIYSLVKKGVLSGASVGIGPTKAYPRVPGDRSKGLVIEKSRVYEWSVCPTPVCPRCVRADLDAASPPVRKALAGCDCGCGTCKTKREGRAVLLEKDGLQLAEVFFPADKFTLDQANECLKKAGVTMTLPVSIREDGIRYGLIEPETFCPNGSPVDEVIDGIHCVYRKMAAEPPVVPDPVVSDIKQASVTAAMTPADQPMPAGDWHAMKARCKAMIADVHEGLTEHSGHGNLTHTQATACKSYCGTLKKAMSDLDDLPAPPDHMGRPVTKADPAPQPSGPPPATAADWAAFHAAKAAFERAKYRALGQ